MAFATTNSPANRKPGDNAQTATPPQAQAQQRQSPGKAEPPPLRAPEPQHAPEPPACAGAKTGRVRWRPCSGEPSPRRAPEPPTRRDENRAPERQPSRPSDFGVLIELSTKFPWHYPSRVPHSQSSSRAEYQIPRALAGPSSEFPRRKIVNFVQLRSKLTILRSLKAKTRDYLRYRKAHTRTTDKNVRFPLPRPRKTACFDRQRPKLTVFRIPHPTDSQPHSQQATLPSPISAMEGFFARLKNADNGNRVLPPSRLVRRDDSRVLLHSQHLPQALQ